MNDPASLAADWRWLPHRLDEHAAIARFIRLDRDDHRAATFLEDSYLPPSAPRVDARVDAVAAAVPRRETNAHLILHSAFACSTLMARAFDIPGVAMGLKEPFVLNDAAQRILNAANPAALVEPILTLLERPFGEDEAVIIKPSNIANNLVPAMLTARPGWRAVIMYSPLPGFLQSVAKKGLFGRVWARRNFAFLRRWGALDAGYSEAEVFEQADLQIAAMVWLTHQAHFCSLIRQFGGRLLTIDSNRFLEQKAASFEALAGHFGLQLDAEAIASGPAFDQHSKQLGRTFGAARREQEYAEVDRAYGEEISMVLHWATTVAQVLKVPMELPSPLLRG